MVKQKTVKQPPKNRFLKASGVFLFIVLLIVIFFATSTVYFFATYSRDKVFPGVHLDGIEVGNQTLKDIEEYYLEKSEPLKDLSLLLTFEDKVATISGNDLKAGYDAKLAATQAYSIGRSGNLLSDIYQIWRAQTSGIFLTSVFFSDELVVDETLHTLSENIDIPAQDALFQFEKGKVTAFTASKDGRKLNIPSTKALISETISLSAVNGNRVPALQTIALPVETVVPSITTQNSNNYGIRELIGTGKSTFKGSIVSRMKNIALAASRLSGKLIPPGEIFSFNGALGDVSAATGFLPAYIIQEGRTVLGDGGGVCQVSTTLFRAALSAGLPIEERRAHAYRVSYYEQDSGPGLDATVFAPSVDLKFKNDTGHHVLIQASADIPNASLTFELYGTADGRRSEVTKPVILSQTPPPEDFYQDDPTLQAGVVKQVDWRAWGAKVNFSYKVYKGEELIYDKSFYSVYQPWRAVFLRGTKV